MENKTMENIPTKEIFLNDDEIAINIGSSSIFSLTTESLGRLLESYGWRPFFYCSFKDRMIQVYKDGIGNSLVIEHEPGFYFNEEIKVGIQGISTDVNGCIFHQDGYEEIVDLSKYAKLYPENVFSTAIQRIKEKLEEREKKRNLAYI